MNSAELKQKLHSYIDVAEEKKLKAIYVMVEDEIEHAYQYTNDAGFMNELNKRIVDLESGVDKGASWNTVKKKINKVVHPAQK